MNKSKSLLVSTVRWALTHGSLTDRERADVTADKCRFWIESWEAVKAGRGRWLTVADLMSATGGAERQCRRMALRLAATGLCEMRGSQGVPYRIRIKRAK